MKHKIIACLLLCCFYLTGFSQILPPKEKHLIYLNSGYDYSLFTINLGYAYYFDTYKTAVFTDFSQGTALLGSGNFRTQLGLQTWQGSLENFNLKTSVAFVYTRSVNNVGIYDGVGMNVTLNPGVIFNRTSLGLDVQYNPFFATHIKHSEHWRQEAFADTKDGWYDLTANNLRFGAYFSHWIDQNQSWELNLKAGYQTNGQYDKLIPQLYFLIDINKQIK